MQEASWARQPSRTPPVRLCSQICVCEGLSPASLSPSAVRRGQPSGSVRSPVPYKQLSWDIENSHFNNVLQPLLLENVPVLALSSHDIHCCCP